MKFVNSTNGLFIEKNSLGIKAFFKAMKKFDDPVLFITNEDFSRLQDKSYLNRHQDIRPGRVKLECSRDEEGALGDLVIDRCFFFLRTPQAGTI